MTGIPNNDLITSFGYIGVIDSIKQQRDSAMAEVRALQSRIAELEGILQELWTDNPAIPLSDYYTEKIRKAIGK